MTARRQRWAWVDHPGAAGSEPTFYVLALPDGSPYALSSLSALIWQLALARDADIPTVVAQQVGVPVSEARDMVGVVLVDLADKGLIPRQQTTVPTT